MATLFAYGFVSRATGNNEASGGGVLLKESAAGKAPEESNSGEDEALPSRAQSKDGAMLEVFQRAHHTVVAESSAERPTSTDIYDDLRKDAKSSSPLHQIAKESDGAKTSFSQSAKENSNGNRAGRREAHQGLSDYEKARLENIRRNEEFMRSIGLIDARNSLGNAAAAVRGAAKKKKSAVKRKRPLPRTGPTRRSRRLQAKPAADLSEAGALAQCTAPEEPEEKDLPFDDSLVTTYSAVVEDGDHVSDAPVPLPQPPPAAASAVERLREVTPCFQDESLKKIYALSFSPNRDLLAAAGHQGRAAIFASSGASAGDVLLSFKAHKGWVASAHFLNQHTLLTAANDAVVTIWDIRKVLSVGSNARPRIMHSESSLHSNGIFSAHVFGSRLATASKDKSVAYSSVDGAGGVQLIRSFEGFHSGVVKCAALRDDHVLASTGNDLSVCVCDARSKSGLVTQIEDAHRLAVNHVSWNPSSDYELMTASFGNAIHLWDTRKPKEPTQTLKGHAMLYDGQRGGIYHPVYAASGRSVITPGAKTDCITVFDATDGKVVSKGSTSIGEVTCLSACDADASRLAAARGSKIILLDPVWLH